MTHFIDVNTLLRINTIFKGHVRKYKKHILKGQEIRPPFRGHITSNKIYTHEIVGTADRKEGAIQLPMYF